MMSIGYYPGCSLTGTSREYDLSLREVLGALEVELREIDDWSCCGASSAHAVSHLLSIALPARNLILARQQEIAEIMAPCAACYNRLVGAQMLIEQHPRIREGVEYALEEPWNGGAATINIIQLLQRVGLDAIKAKVAMSLSGINVACYYGCLLVRPGGVVNFDDAENPSSMEAIVGATGAKSVKWNYRTECCGGAHSIARTDIVLDLSKKILDDARGAGADVVVVACPMCHVNLDMRQRAMRQGGAESRDIPILYLSELLGLAFGVEQKKLGLDLHFIDTAPFVKKAGGKEASA